MSALQLVWHQFRFDQRVFWRVPAAVFFTVALPVIFLFLFVTIFGNETASYEGRPVRNSTFQVPGLVTLGVVSATLVNLAISLTIARERGVLKRLRATPLPAWAFIAGKVLTAVMVEALLVVVLVGLGRIVYGVPVPGATLPGAMLALAVGTFTFCALGFALAALIPSEAAAPPIANALVLPLYFVSGVFIPSELLPDGLQLVGDLFPIAHLFEALVTAFVGDDAPGIAVGHLAAVLAWGLGGLAVALAGFRWSPRSRRS